MQSKWRRSNEANAAVDEAAAVVDSISAAASFDPHRQLKLW